MLFLIPFTLSTKLTCLIGEDVRFTALVAKKLGGDGHHHLLTRNELSNEAPGPGGCPGHSRYREPVTKSAVLAGPLTYH